MTQTQQDYDADLTKTNFFKKNINKDQKEFKKSKDRFSRLKIKEIRRRNLYERENKKIILH